MIFRRILETKQMMGNGVHIPLHSSNIFCVQHKKEIHTGLKQLEGE